MQRPFPFLTASFRSVLLFFIAIDLAFIVTHVLALVLLNIDAIATIPHELLVTDDHTYPEDYNYLKWAVIVVSLVWVALRDRRFPTIAWAVIFLMILTDDSMQIHEWLGDSLSRHLHIPALGLFTGSDTGEVMVFLLMAMVAAGLTVLTFVGQDDDTRRMSRLYLAVFVGLGFFGVGVDALHEVVSHLADGHHLATYLPEIFGLIEDGGEMLVASVAAALTLCPPTDRGSRRMTSPTG